MSRSAERDLPRHRERIEFHQRIEPRREVAHVERVGAGRTSFMCGVDFQNESRTLVAWRRQHDNAGIRRQLGSHQEAAVEQGRRDASNQYAPNAAARTGHAIQADATAKQTSSRGQVEFQATQSLHAESPAKLPFPAPQQASLHVPIDAHGGPLFGEPALLPLRGDRDPAERRFATCERADRADRGLWHPQRVQAPHRMESMNPPRGFRWAAGVMQSGPLTRGCDEQAVGGLELPQPALAAGTESRQFLPVQVPIIGDG